MEEYRAGHLAKVQKLDGNPTFDPDVLAQMVPLDKIAGLAGDQSESVRQLVATMLSRTADPKWTTTLIKLVDDKSPEVGREAAVGLGKIANEQAMGPLLNALSRADKDSRQKFLEALRDGVGSKGLVLALRSVQTATPERQKFQTKQLFDMMHDLEDPRAGDLLVAYIASNPKPHWKTEAALRLAEVGDVRAVPTLAWRMQQDPLKIYNKAEEPELMQDDNERVVSARMLADLSVLFPDKVADIRSQAESSVADWAINKPQPHANALRFFAASDSRDMLPKMRKWANPPDRFPQPGQQDFPQSWATAQSALRYIGWMKDDQSWSLLTAQLTRRPEKVDATMDSLMQGGLAVLGMTLRAIGVGAGHGLAQWGDNKAYAPLVKYIEDKENNEQSRLEACFSLSWVANDDQMNEVVTKVKTLTKPDPKESLVRACYLETLIHRPVPNATASLVDLIKPDTDLEVRHQAARAVGFGGIKPDTANKLLEMIKNADIRSDAALAILIGGDADTVRRMMAMFNDFDPGAMEELKVIYNQTFGYWSDKNFENGDLARWIENADACAHVRVKDALQDWPRLILARAIQGIDFDNGPHSVTRVQLRVRLMRDALGQDANKREQAIKILKFMKEKGVLMALRQEPAPLGELARQAFFEVMNPKAVSDTLPDVKVPAGAGVVPPK
jgi:HEAT repeat protein